MNTNKTSVIFLLDKSGSMDHLQTDTIGGFNKLVEDQRAGDGECEITLYQFGIGSYCAIPATNAASFPRLDETRYNPSDGGTALFDAICDTIDSAGQQFAHLPEYQRPGKVVFIIITDGLENCSRKFGSNDVKDRIERQKSVYKWQFVFTGANQDAILSARNIGIAANAAANYSADPFGTRVLYGTMSAKLSQTRSAAPGTATMDFNADDRTALLAGSEP